MGDAKPMIDGTRHSTCGSQGKLVLLERFENWLRLQTSHENQWLMAYLDLEDVA
jgi:hypothetical protein